MGFSEKNKSRHRNPALFLKKKKKKKKDLKMTKINQKILLHLRKMYFF